MDLRQTAQEIGIDLEANLGRFMGNEELYVKFLKKFTEDKNMEYIAQAQETMNIKDLEAAAHALKGVAANLGLQGVSDRANSIVVCCRSGKYDDILNLCTDCRKEYEKVCSTLKNLE